MRISIIYFIIYMQVGPTYGRRMMRGYLIGKGFRAGEHQVAHALQEANANHYMQRREGTATLRYLLILSTE